MYIKKYWGNFIGGSDDSLNLVAFLEDQKKEEMPLSEIFAKIGLDKQNWNFRQTVGYLEFTHSNGVEMDFHFAMDVVTDLAAILLECKMCIRDRPKDGANSISDTESLLLRPQFDRLSPEEKWPIMERLAAPVSYTHLHPGRASCWPARSGSLPQAPAWLCPRCHSRPAASWRHCGRGSRRACSRH